MKLLSSPRSQCCVLSSPGLSEVCLRLLLVSETLPLAFLCGSAPQAAKVFPQRWGRTHMSASEEAVWAVFSVEINFYQQTESLIQFSPNHSGSPSPPLPERYKNVLKYMCSMWMLTSSCSVSSSLGMKPFSNHLGEHRWCVIEFNRTFKHILKQLQLKYKDTGYLLEFCCNFSTLYFQRKSLRL